MTHPNCDHNCTSNCRREGCNCLCGEFHDSATEEEIQESLADELRDIRIGTVKMLLMKYVYLKPEYDGMMCYSLAGKIVDSLFPESEEEEVLPDYMKASDLSKLTIIKK